jgi:hypothetical protein
MDLLSCFSSPGANPKIIEAARNSEVIKKVGLRFMTVSSKSLVE